MNEERINRIAGRIAKKRPYHSQIRDLDYAIHGAHAAFMEATKAGDMGKVRRILKSLDKMAQERIEYLDLREISERR